MASFKLGRIKGERGDSGAKGDRGDIGAKGEQGPVPVLTVESVQTVDSREDATVEINSADPLNPKLLFRIPKGLDGKDAFGDMAESIYDTEGKKTDIYKFADELFKKCLLKTGGVVSGKLMVSDAPANENCVRNIIFSSTLPESAAEGDVCFIVPKSSESTLDSSSTGSVLLIKEDDEEAEYIVAHKEYHKAGTVTLVRKHLVGYSEYFNYPVREGYGCSNIDLMLENVHTKLFPEFVQKQLVAVKIEGAYKRRCFLPSVSELSGIEYFKNNGIIAKTKEGLSKDYYMTRTLTEKKTVTSVSNKGELVPVSQTTKTYFRPIIVLPGGFKVDNFLHQGNAVMKPVSSAEARFFNNGEWKEFVI